jgi:hypothetical protein
MRLAQTRYVQVIAAIFVSTLRAQGFHNRSGAAALAAQIAQKIARKLNYC